jgi:hypothetical protein
MPALAGSCGAPAAGMRLDALYFIRSSELKFRN